MPEICDMLEYKCAYEMLDILNDYCHRDPFNFTLEEERDKLKRKIRRFQRRPLSDRKRFDGSIDGYTELLKLGNFRSQKDADDYFRMHEFIECSYSPYDCTGRPFTCWYKIFTRHGNYWAYHRVGYDV